MIRIDDLIATVSEFIPKETDSGLIGKAYVYSATLHRDQFFPGGGTYLQHALEVSYILAEMRLDLVCIVAGLLHDVLDEELTGAGELRATVGEDAAALIEELSKLSKASYRGSEESRAEHMRQMILASTKDLRVILILLADRLQLLRNQEQLQPDDRTALARETLHIYSPIAHRLGIFYFLAEMEDLAFRILLPQEAEELHQAVESRVAERRQQIERFNNEINNLFQIHGMKGEVNGRTKHLYSIHQKLQKNRIGLEQVYDLLATRIVMENNADCYRVLGLVHATYTPLPGRFKDYIALPKDNGYRSLHTTVFGSDGEIVEIQIRTREMHRQAELGIAAHFIYKNGSAADPRELADLQWFRGVLEHMEAGKNPRETMELLQRDLVPDEIFVFTPAGEVIKLPARATAIDFAYAIHSDIGNRCVGAKVDGRMIPIREPLPNGSVVEIITSNRGVPHDDWLKSAETSEALSQIRAFLRQEEQAKTLEVGREQCRREAKRLGIKMDALLAMEEVKDWMHCHSLRTEEALYTAQGEGQVRIQDALEKVSAPDSPHKADKKPAASRRKAPPMEKQVRISGMAGLMVRFARCCIPQYGDPLVGIITRGQGVSIHRTRCKNLNRVKNRDERLVEVEWVGEEALKEKVTLVVKSRRSMKPLPLVTDTLEEEEDTSLQSGPSQPKPAPISSG